MLEYRNYENLIVQRQNNENHILFRIQRQNHENHKNLIIPFQNHENQEIRIIQTQNHENHENLCIPLQNHKYYAILRILCQNYENHSKKIKSEIFFVFSIFAFPFSISSTATHRILSFIIIIRRIKNQTEPKVPFEQQKASVAKW